MPAPGAGVIIDVMTDFLIGYVVAAGAGLVAIDIDIAQRVALRADLGVPANVEAGL